MNIEQFAKCKCGDTVYEKSSMKTGVITSMVVGPTLEESEIHVEAGFDHEFSIFPDDYEKDTFQGLESQLFNWEGWDDNGPMCPQFYQVILKVPVGEFPIGHKFPVAFFNGDKSTISFMDDDDVEHVFELRLSIRNRVTETNVQD